MCVLFLYTSVCVGCVCVFRVSIKDKRIIINKNLETNHLAPKLFYYLPGFDLKTEFLNPHPLSLAIKYIHLIIEF